MQVLRTSSAPSAAPAALPPQQPPAPLGFAPLSVRSPAHRRGRYGRRLPTPTRAVRTRSRAAVASRAAGCRGWRTRCIANSSSFGRSCRRPHRRVCTALGAELHGRCCMGTAHGTHARHGCTIGCTLTDCTHTHGLHAHTLQTHTHAAHTRCTHKGCPHTLPTHAAHTRFRRPPSLLTTW